MAQRIIPCRVIGDYLTGDGVTVGGAGSHNEVLLELDFRAADALWAGTTRTVTFTDALGQDPVNVLLTADLLRKDGDGNPVDPEVYLCPVPYGVKKYPGWISVTVSGVEVSGSGLTGGETERLRIATGAARFRVLPNEAVRWLDDDRQVPWPPASVTEQLQAEIDEIRDLIRTQWVYLFVGEDDPGDGTEGGGFRKGWLYAQSYTAQPFGFRLTEDGILEVTYE